MSKNVTNPGMSVDDYENMAVQKSNTAKRVAAGVAVGLVGGAAVAGGSAYAAGHTGMTEPETPLTLDDVKEGADVASTYQEEVHETQHVVHEHKVVEVPEEPKEEIPAWEETTVVYDGDKKVGSIETGTYKGHKFALYDLDGDDHADYLAVDADGNGRFDDNEIQAYEPSDHIHMGHATASTKEIHHDHINPYYASTGSNGSSEEIHNDFQDEKTGEAYHGDLAENNQDYNSDANTDDYESSVDNDYLAESDDYNDDSANYDDGSYIG